MKVLKFYSKTCGPCMAMGLNLNRSQIKHEEIDVESESSEELMKRYDIRHIPTLLILDGEDVVEKVGFTNVNELKELKQKYKLD